MLQVLSSAELSSRLTQRLVERRFQDGLRTAKDDTSTEVYSKLLENAFRNACESSTSYSKKLNQMSSSLNVFGVAVLMLTYNGQSVSLSLLPVLTHS